MIGHRVAIAITKLRSITRAQISSIKWLRACRGSKRLSEKLPTLVLNGLEHEKLSLALSLLIAHALSYLEVHDSHYLMLFP